MIYPATFEQKIGFDRVREQVAALCTMRVARERIAAEGFSTSPREIERRLSLADEMRVVLDMERDFPGGEYPDVDHIVAKLRVEGSFLDVEEVVTLGRALAAVGDKGRHGLAPGKEVPDGGLRPGRRLLRGERPLERVEGQYDFFQFHKQ